MNKASSSSLWLEHLQEAIEEAQAIPFWGALPPFPWSTFSEELGLSFGLNSLSISPKSISWKEGSKLLDGLGNDPALTCLSLTPLSPGFVFAMPRQNLDVFFKLIFAKNGSKKGFSDEDLQKGFYAFALLALLQQINDMNLYKGLFLTETESFPLPEDGAFCTDLSIRCEGSLELFARLILPKELHLQLRTTFTEPVSLLANNSFLSLPLEVSLEVGSTSTSAREWALMNVGDLLLLDHCSYDLSQNQGNGLLSIEGTALFRVKIKENKVKILEKVFYQEETLMPHRNQPPHPPEDEFIDSSSEESLEEEKQEQDSDEETLISSKDIPLTVKVEVGHLKLSLEKLTQLSIGNVLDLNVNPHLNVYLTVSGKRIAKGELIQLGEHLGVKILLIPK